jgi:hypothetical protein
VRSTILGFVAGWPRRIDRRKELMEPPGVSVAGPEAHNWRLLLFPVFRMFLRIMQRRSAVVVVGIYRSPDQDDPLVSRNLRDRTERVSPDVERFLSFSGIKTSERCGTLLPLPLSCWGHLPRQEVARPMPLPAPVTMATLS